MKRFWNGKSMLSMDGKAEKRYPAGLFTDSTTRL
jgi:hypothetical protein